MLQTVRAMPWGVRLFLLYALLILAGIGVALPYVVALAIGAPISFEGLIVMILLAYTIFTVTLVWQRKEAARGLMVGLVSLTAPTALLLLLGGFLVPAVFVGALGALLYMGIRRPAVTSWLSEP